MARVVLGTRGSPLAMWQARHVARRLGEVEPGLEVELKTIKTEGDLRHDVPFGQIPGKGFFVKEIEAALLGGEIDLAVHSLKDVPSELPEGLTLAAILERHDPRDAILTEAGTDFEGLAVGAVLATASLRRRCQLLHARPDLRAVAVRGNVDTRIRKLREGRFGALVLALAGVQRLGIAEVPVKPLSTSVCLPAVGQGAMAIETREDDAATRRAAARLAHEPTARATRAERSFLARLGGGCLAPATAFAVVRDGEVRIEGVVGEPDGRRLLRDRVEGRAGREERLGDELAQRLIRSGADEILRASREAGGGLHAR
jgi:hydroxymethylbilane synthase